ncbi:hypothetical protein CSC2_34930 [Clostridium zeae]|uniref:Uncharacterized protein n=1 Tax=Clostridium zeae TaxID=2759022 RepID=A0ABQ1EDV7_9CLOT|nr:hypothetical protein [Clostridium zeae]GFZ32967.1 hypothetical protein CSC2_34930 [Clostridium zeae]
MRNFKMVLFITLIIFCGSLISDMGFSKKKTIDLGKLEKDLNNVSYSFDFYSQKNMLLGSKRTIEVGKEDVIIYDYKDIDLMEIDEASISKDGYVVGNYMIDWASKPHFYKNNSSIVQYIGDDNKVIKALSDLCGKQFAGQE